MTSPVVTARSTISLPEAVDLMLRHRIRRLVVVGGGKSGAPLGIVTGNDLVRHFPRGINPFSPLRSEVDDERIPSEIGKIMSRQVRTIDSQAPIERAAVLMTEGRISTLPVMHGDALVGIVTETDVFKAFAGLVGGLKPNVRVTFAMTSEEDILEFLIGLVRNREIQISSFLTFYQDGKKRGVVRMQGSAVQEIIDEIWNSGHNVISVLREPGFADGPKSSTASTKGNSRPRKGS